MREKPKPEYVNDGDFTPLLIPLAVVVLIVIWLVTK